MEVPDGEMRNSVRNNQEGRKGDRYSGKEDDQAGQVMVISLILIAIGVIALLINLGVLSGSLWSYVWPIILIILGLAILLGRRSRRGWWRYWRGSGEDGKRQ